MGQPPRRLRLDLTLAPADGLKILAIGGPLDPGTHSELVMRGCVVDVVTDLGAGLGQLHAARFDVVTVRPTIEVQGDGVRFVRGLKSLTKVFDEGRVGYSAGPYDAVPFIILPLEGSREFAMFRDPQRWYLGDTLEVPLFRAILAARWSDGGVPSS